MPLSLVCRYDRRELHAEVIQHWLTAPSAQTGTFDSSSAEFRGCQGFTLTLEADVGGLWGYVPPVDHSEGWILNWAKTRWWIGLFLDTDN